MHNTNIVTRTASAIRRARVIARKRGVPAEPLDGRLVAMNRLLLLVLEGSPRESYFNRPRSCTDPDFMPSRNPSCLEFEMQSWSH